MNEREYDFSALSERISAQTEAYVEFSNALVKVIENSAHIRDRVNDTNTLIKDDFRFIDDKLQELVILTNKLTSEIQNQQHLKDRDIDAIHRSVKSLDENIKSMVESHDHLIASINKVMVDLADKSKVMLEHIIRNNTDSITKIEENIKTTKAIAKDMEEFKGSLNVANLSFQKAKLLFWAISIVLAIITTLMGFNIINVSWFPK